MESIEESGAGDKANVDAMRYRTVSRSDRIEPRAAACYNPYVYFQH
jgi:hypothetical protein